MLCAAVLGVQRLYGRWILQRDGAVVWWRILADPLQYGYYVETRFCMFWYDMDACSWVFTVGAPWELCSCGPGPLRS